MSKVEKTTLEDNVYRISVTLEKADVQKEFTKKLKEYRKTAQWKGFRKGTAPLTFVKKMVGNQIFNEMVEKMTTKALFDKIEEDKINYIGSPMVAEDLRTPPLSMETEEDIHFVFELVAMPEVAIKEPTNKTFDFYKVNNLKDVAKKELEQAQISMGKEEPTEAKFDESAVLTIQLSELEGKEAKEGGVTHEATLRIAEIENEKLVKKLAKAKVGDAFDFAPFADLTVKDEQYITTTYLGLEDDFEGELPQKFTAEIISATKKVPAELNQELFDGLFGPGTVDSEEQAIEKLVEFFEAKYTNEANQILLMSWKQYLQENNEIELPSAYIKKVIVVGNQGIDEDALEEDLPIIEKDLVWSTIRDGLIKKYDVAPATEHDIEHAIAHSIGSQYGIDPHHEIIMNIARDTMKKDQNKVEATFKGIMEGRLFDTIKDSLKTKDVELSDVQFADKIKEVFEG